LAGGGAHMKLQVVGTANKVNVEHRTSNIDDATLYLLLKQANNAEDVI